MNDQNAINLLNILGLIEGSLQRIEQHLEESRWTCGCGTINSIGNVWCRTCKRREGETS
jgi:hypothetical protein